MTTVNDATTPQKDRSVASGRSVTSFLPSWPRLFRIVALAVIVGVGINHLWWSLTDWHLQDMDAYWEAGLRLRLGEPLYPPVSDVLASNVYRYSPWFAWLWAPLTTVPRPLVDIAWSAVLVGASIAAVWPMARQGAWIGVAFFLPILIGISAGGNVQALLIAALVWTVERPSGPVWIGVAASLKFFPILFALTYLGRRQWLRSVLAGGVTLALLAPFLAYDLSDYVTTAGAAALLWEWPAIYVLAVAVSAMSALWLARGRFGWLASATAVFVALPRSFLYDVTWLVVGAPVTDEQRVGASLGDSSSRLAAGQTVKPASEGERRRSSSP